MYAFEDFALLEKLCDAAFIPLGLTLDRVVIGTLGKGSILHAVQNLSDYLHIPRSRGAGGTNV